MFRTERLRLNRAGPGLGTIDMQNVTPTQPITPTIVEVVKSRPAAST